MFEIRNFGNNVICPDIASIMSAIHQFNGKSISIDDRRPGGKVFHLDVQAHMISESYASRRVVDLPLLLETPGKPVYP